MPLQAINAVTLLLLIIGGINWALVGVFDFNLVTTILALPETTTPSTAARALYVLIGLSAVWQGVVLFRRLLVPVDRAT